MKKIITLILTVALLLTAMVSCSSNDTKVAVIWSEQNDDYLFSISDALDRAFYIKRVKYKHYDAEGNSGKQLELVDQAIASGTKVLVVNPTDAATATAVVSKARAANLPVVFLCNDEASFEAIKLAGYEKAYTVDVDAGTITSVLGNKIASDLAADYKKYDRNGDGKITIASLGIVGAATVDEINTELKRLKEGDAENKPLRSLKKIDNPQVVLMDAKYYGSTSVETVDRMFADFQGVGSDEVKPTAAEVIVLDDQNEVDDVLLTMRKYDLNYKKLVTHFIPIYTVGNTANMGNLLADNAKQAERDAYSVLSSIDSGYLAGAVVADDNGIATAVASMVRSIIKGKEVFSKVVAEQVKDGSVFVPYTTYG